MLYDKKCWCNIAALNPNEFQCNNVQHLKQKTILLFLLSKMSSFSTIAKSAKCKLKNSKIHFKTNLATLLNSKVEENKLAIEKHVLSQPFIPCISKTSSPDAS